jgi:hypothetical protein
MRFELAQAHALIEGYFTFKKHSRVDAVSSPP